MSLHPKYPNLELLEYKTIQFLYSDQDIKQALEDWKLYPVCPCCGEIFDPMEIRRFSRKPKKEGD